MVARAREGWVVEVVEAAVERAVAVAARVRVEAAVRAAVGWVAAAARAVRAA